MGDSIGCNKERGQNASSSVHGISFRRNKYGETTTNEIDKFDGIGDNGGIVGDAGTAGFGVSVKNYGEKNHSWITPSSGENPAGPRRTSGVNAAAAATHHYLQPLWDHIQP